MVFAGLTLVVTISLISFIRMHPGEARAPPALIGTIASLLPIAFFLTGLPLLLSLPIIILVHVAINYVVVATHEIQRLRHLAAVDALTGLRNRGALDKYLINSIGYALRDKGRSLSLMMIDLDYFKYINDTYGHTGGDKVLRRVASIIEKQVRAEDAVFRYGGEEFAVIMPETDAAGAVTLAQKIRRAIEDTPIIIDGKPVEVTASFGVAQYHSGEAKGEGEAAEEFIARADKALYN